MQLMAKLGISGLVVAIATIAYQPILQAQNQTQKSPLASTQLVSQNALKSAAFVGEAHPATGSAKIVEDNGQRYLEFDAAFRTDAGPDLVVLLHKEAVPSDYGPENYINLGQIQRVGGMQRYAIPADADLQAIQSAVVWCRAFDVTFAYATL